MSIGIRLEDKNENLLERIYKEGNDEYLVKGEDNPDFPNLSMVERYDYSVFGAKRMDALIEELLKVRAELPNPADQEHIDDIIRLANRCKEDANTVLVFAG